MASADLSLRLPDPSSFGEDYQASLLKSARAKSMQGGLRDYLGARFGRGMSFIAQLQRQDAEIRKDIAALRAHSRHLDKNNPFMRSFLRAMDSQVVGPDGFTLQSELKRQTADGLETWAPYTDRIEARFCDWARRGTCTVDGRSTFEAVQRLAVRTMALDGECLIHKVNGFPNGWGFALQFLDADLLDHNLNREPSRNQNAIVMGVELDGWGRPVMYHFRDPILAWSNAYPYGTNHVQIPASEIIHLYDPERVNQTRGVPFAAPAMYLMAMLGALWESETAASRFEAERLAFLKSKDGSYGEPATDDQLRKGVLALTSPGIHYQAIPAGSEIEIPQMNHPNSAFDPFSRRLLQGIAAALGVSYAALTADLTQASYSSMRQGELINRDQLRRLQAIVREGLLEPVFESWLAWSVMGGKVKLPPGVRLESAQAHTWTARGWDWVDPQKDIQAAVLAINNGLDTRSSVLAAKGKDFASIAKKLAEEQQLLTELGVKLAPLGGAVSVAKEEPDGETTVTGKENANGAVA